jgi:hypothetical protein
MPPELKYKNFLKDCFLGKSTKHPLYVIVSEIESNNPFSTMERALKTMELFVNICNFYDRRTELNWHEACLVIDDNEISSLISFPPNPLKCGCERDSTIISGNIEQTLDSLSSDYFSKESVFTLVNAMDYHRTALETKFTENQLLDLWAAFEGLLPNPIIETSRIAYFTENILPSITLSYSKVLFEYIVDNLIMYGEEVYNFINGIEIDGNIFDKTVAIISCNDMQDKRKVLYSMLDDSPFIKNTVYEYHNIFK